MQLLVSSPPANTLRSHSSAVSEMHGHQSLAFPSRPEYFRCAGIRETRKGKASGSPDSCQPELSPSHDRDPGNSWPGEGWALDAQVSGLAGVHAGSSRRPEPSLPVASQQSVRTSAERQSTQILLLPADPLVLACRESPRLDRRLSDTTRTIWASRLDRD